MNKNIWLYKLLFFSKIGMEDSHHRDEDPNTWRGWARSMLIWAAQDPWTFIFNIFLILSPLLFTSLYLSYRLSRDIDSQKKEKKKKVKREAKGKKKKNKGTVVY